MESVSSLSSIAERSEASERSTVQGILQLAEHDGLRWSDLWLDGRVFAAVKGLEVPQVQGVHRKALAQHAGAPKD